MSRALLDAEGSHLHSPVDDLESFFWVAVWSVFFNKDIAKGHSNGERSIRDHLVGCRKSNAMDKYSTLVCDATTSNIVQRFQAVLFDWWTKVQNRSATWSRKVLRDAPQNAGREYYLPHFHRFALEGVADVLQVLSDHWNDEIGWESWAAPKPS